MSIILKEGNWKPILVDFSLKSMKDKFCSSKKIAHSLRASSPIWASEASLASRERSSVRRGAEERRICECQCLSRVYFSRYPPNGELARRPNCYYASIVLNAPILALCPTLSRHNMSNPSLVSQQFMTETLIFTKLLTVSFRGQYNIISNSAWCSAGVRLELMNI